MRFKDNEGFSKITLSDSYNENYKFLIESTKKDENNNVQLFNSIPIFKYEKLILKFQKEPTKDEIKNEIKNFLNMRKEDLKVFSIKGNVFKISEDLREYVINVAFINFDVKSK